MTEIKPHSSHWGAFDAIVRDGRLVEASSFARDPAPGALLLSMPDAVHGAARIDRPYVREGWLTGGLESSTLFCPALTSSVTSDEHCA
jgi:biotin/methionine sulfoxide reductase